jgi:methyl-accepting chemotaxis protein
MNRISVIHRLYAGFGLLCVIIVCWGAFNISIMSSFSGATDRLTSDVFPLSGLIQEMEAHRSETARYSVEVVAAGDQKVLSSQSARLSDALNKLGDSLDAFVASDSTAMFPELVAVNESANARLAELQKSVKAILALKGQLLSVSDSVNSGLSDFLANNGEMKRTLVREGTEPAG